MACRLGAVGTGQAYESRLNGVTAHSSSQLPQLNGVSFDCVVSDKDSKF